MKKINISVSPFLMLIVPVLFAILLSLSFKSTDTDSDNELTTITTSETTAQKLVKTSKASVLWVLLHK